MGDAWPCPLDANEEAARLARTRARAPSLKLRRKPTGRVAPPVENEEQRARRKRWDRVLGFVTNAKEAKMIQNFVQRNGEWKRFPTSLETFTMITGVFAKL